MSPRSHRMWTTLAARILLIPYLIALGLIVWLPASEASKATGIVFAFARWVSELTSLDRTTSATVFEFLANIVLFVPLGLIVSLSWPGHPLWGVALLGCVVSITIELIQLLLPSRVTTISDVVANTTGAACGALAKFQRQRRYVLPPTDAGSRWP